MQYFIKSFDCHHYSCLESTNATAKASSAKSYDFLEKGIVHTFYADRQTAGYGKVNRKWMMKPGNVAVSFLFSSKAICSRDITQLTFIFCISVGRTLRAFGIKDSAIEYKWPNDILVSGRKIGGVLLETDFSFWEKENEDKSGYIVAGVGLNIVGSSHKQSFIFPATSMEEEGGCNPSVLEFIEKLSFYIKRYYNSWVEDGFEHIKELWSEKAWKKNGQLTININDREKIKGKFLGIKEDGALCIRCMQTDEIRLFYSADVF